MSAITYTAARRLVDRALTLAEEKQAPIAAVVVDRSGAIVMAARVDAAAPVMVELAQRKAALAAAVGAPTAVLAKMAETDPILAGGLRSVGDHLLLPGGVPVMGPGGVPEGALGIAGGHYDIDHELAAESVRRTGG